MKPELPSAASIARQLRDRAPFLVGAPPADDNPAAEIEAPPEPKSAFATEPVAFNQWRCLAKLMFAIKDGQCFTAQWDSASGFWHIAVIRDGIVNRLTASPEQLQSPTAVRDLREQVERQFAAHDGSAKPPQQILTHLSGAEVRIAGTCYNRPPDSAGTWWIIISADGQKPIDSDTHANRKPPVD